MGRTNDRGLKTEALKKKKHHPVLKRVLIAALTLVMLTVGALAVSADSAGQSIR